VVEAHVEVLGDLHVVRRDAEVVVGEPVQPAPVVAGHGQDLYPLPLRVFRGLQDVPGVAGAGDGEDQVALPELVLDLVEEDVVEGHVVRDRRQGRDVVVQADEPEALPDVRAGPLVEVAGHVGGRGGAAAVPEGVDRAFPLVAGEEGVHRPAQLGGVEAPDGPHLAGVVVPDVFGEIYHGLVPSAPILTYFIFKMVETASWRLFAVNVG